MMDFAVTGDGFEILHSSEIQEAGWQVACRALEPAEFVSELAAVLKKAVPLHSLQIWSLHPQAPELNRIASYTANDWPDPETSVCLLSERERKGCVEWIRSGTASAGLSWPETPNRLPWGSESESGFAIPLAGKGFQGLAWVKLDPRNPAGTLTAVAPLPVESLLDSVRSPIIACLERLLPTPTGAESSAAQAEKRSLLRRLGRQENLEPDWIVGEQGGLKQVMERVRLVVDSGLPVLLLGETGTGKELVARAIHQRSLRRSGPFIRVNCGAIPPELVDSQLFGHERGSFTGADARRQGWFERADRGTLFLDEIGELPAGAQIRFLRVLQDGFVERVGGSEPVHVDVRIVAATHRDLAAMVREHSFREDLWYRLAVFPILLPPLRDRPGDIPELASHFAARAAIKFGLPSLALGPADLALLTAYDWPGNIRELGTVIDRAAVLGNGKRLEIARSLGPWSGDRPEIRTGSAAVPRTGPDPEVAGQNDPALLPSLDHVIRAHIEQALAVAAGRIEGPRGAARLLKINPHTLRARMRKLRIDWQRFRTGKTALAKNSDDSGKGSSKGSD